MRASGRRGGGESGIRTHGRVSPTHAFQACSFNHSDISPGEWMQQVSATGASYLPMFAYGPPSAAARSSARAPASIASIE